MSKKFFFAFGEFTIDSHRSLFHMGPNTRSAIKSNARYTTGALRKAPFIVTPNRGSTASTLELVFLNWSFSYCHT